MRAFETFVQKHTESGCFANIAEVRTNTLTTLQDIQTGTIAPMRVLRRALLPERAPRPPPDPAAPVPEAAPAAPPPPRAVNKVVNTAATRGAITIPSKLIDLVNVLYGNNDVRDALAAAETDEDYNSELLEFLGLVLKTAIADKPV
jgi:hypothetical protein